jgi:hypothetical protein
MRPLKVIFWPSLKRNKEFNIHHRNHRNEKRRQEVITIKIILLGLMDK